METFEDFLDKMGYSWTDFDRTHEMADLIEQYADTKIAHEINRVSFDRPVYITLENETKFRIIVEGECISVCKVSSNDDGRIRITPVSSNAVKIE